MLKPSVLRHIIMQTKNLVGLAADCIHHSFCSMQGSSSTPQQGQSQILFSMPDLQVARQRDAPPRVERRGEREDVGRAREQAQRDPRQHQAPVNGRAAQQRHLPRAPPQPGVRSVYPTQRYKDVT